MFCCGVPERERVAERQVLFDRRRCFAALATRREHDRRQRQASAISNRSNASRERKPAEPFMACMSHILLLRGARDAIRSPPQPHLGIVPLSTLPAKAELPAGVEQDSHGESKCQARFIAQRRRSWPSARPCASAAGGEIVGPVDPCLLILRAGPRRALRLARAAREPARHARGTALDLRRRARARPAMRWRSVWPTSAGSSTSARAARWPGGPRS